LTTSLILKDGNVSTAEKLSKNGKILLKMTPLAFFTKDKKSSDKTINSVFFISIQGSYNYVHIALFNGQELIQEIIKLDQKASSHLIPYIQTLLQDNKLSLQDLSFIAIDRGPGAFTSLRVSIATVNGIAFAHKIRLIGINGLEALSLQASTLPSFSDYTKTQTSKPCVLVALLNAYNNDVYFAINTFSPDMIVTTHETGCKNIEQLLAQLKTDFSDNQIFFIGNGSELHRELIGQVFGQQATVPAEIQAVSSAQQIGLMALDIWNNQTEPDYRITPNYIKTQAFAIKK
jgi:tRNA threonylcarbamoyladenosine biosynthesis protein TsaB